MNTSEYRDRDDDSQQRGAVSQVPTTKFIQICASQNDLFALDEDGNIYQYNFNTKAWLKLGAAERSGRPTRSAAREPLAR